ncbi:ABC transporter ATP-binding protein [Aliifodinibius sp. S!AR15-10]|uniref:ABC transporter ATP-binding protein n=1 Tax=Aliifodinibius sp. S!AR15-10 TaxID=2950437 RepID=UPI002865466F|nr:ABC transporter ATP-binding protein [Aliifodinibius sp. S!AR15-10]MDR8391809.1 ABC transporter ATP-binding protein [Aliifodinibius sp. S!AR15-10]
MVKNRNILQTENLKIGYNGRKRATVVAENLDLNLQKGELIGLLGPNGSGKSTLIRTLARMQKPLSGSIHLEDEDIVTLPVKDVAKKVSTVLTDRIRIGNLTVYNLIAFGRSPYTGMMGRLRQKDREIVNWAVESVGLTEFVDRDILKLSDGERQKVMIARALAQDTPVILLDEPTAHLDLPNRVEIVRLLRKLAHDTGKAILMSTHELDLALKASDRVWLMNMQKDLCSGTPEDLVLNGTFEKVFQRDSFDFDRETGSFKIHQNQDKHITLSGDKVPTYWTTRALEREGYVVEVVESKGEVQALDEKGKMVWKVESSSPVTSVSALIEYLRVKT